jgi:translation initiation factor 2B subunit (eIF-2B alpha/beta/delta family)
LEEGEVPIERAEKEIEEELGLVSSEVDLVRSGEPLRVYDEDKDTVWIVHPFLFNAKERNIELDWEHTESKWINPDDLNSYETVPKLRETLERVQWDMGTGTATLPNVTRAVHEFAVDRVHGASILGRRSIEILAEAAKVTTASSINELFSNLLGVMFELRKAQRSMATIRNLTGYFMYNVAESRRSTTSIQQFREKIAVLSQEAIREAEKAAEDTARNVVPFLPDEGYVLTHSYSSTVRRALELGIKSGRKLTAFVTESSPGLEGKQLAKDLVDVSVPLKLIADSIVGSVISDVDMVLIGADSVLTDGSVINKIGSKKIATLAEAEEIPFFVACERAKLSSVDFLGEPVQFAETLFDLTPSTDVTTIVTEVGSMEPRQVSDQIKKVLSHLYP